MKSAESAGLFFNCSWGDYDADGYVDLVVTSNPGSSLLFHNDGDGSFSRVPDSAIEKDSPSTGSIPLWADYDNDGDLDLFVSWMEGFGDMVKLFPAAYTGVEGLLKDRLYRNEGDGTFSRVIEGDWVNDSGDAWGSSSAWADFDNDGHLDLYVGNAHGQRNFLYRNNGDGTMTEVGNGTRLVRGEVETHGVVWTDYNNDGYQDLIVMGQLTRQFRNNGDGTFTPEGLQQDQLFDWGVAAGDYDNDGDMDLAVASWHNNRLYRNDGVGGFTEVMDGVINVEDQIESISPSWADYDNDGYLDLHITNHRGQNNFLYHNEGNGNFSRVTDVSMVNDGGLGWGAAWADYDNDGDLDLVETDGAVWPSVSNSKLLKLYPERRNDQQLAPSLARGSRLQPVGDWREGQDQGQRERSGSQPVERGIIGFRVREPERPAGTLRARGCHHGRYSHHRMAVRGGAGDEGCPRRSVPDRDGNEYGRKTGQYLDAGSGRNRRQCPHRGTGHHRRNASDRAHPGFGGNPVGLRCF